MLLRYFLFTAQVYLKDCQIQVYLNWILYCCCFSDRKKKKISVILFKDEHRCRKTLISSYSYFNLFLCLKWINHRKQFSSAVADYFQLKTKEQTSVLVLLILFEQFEFEVFCSFWSLQSWLSCKKLLTKRSWSFTSVWAVRSGVLRTPVCLEECLSLAVIKCVYFLCAVALKSSQQGKYFVLIRSSL